MKKAKGKRPLYRVYMGRDYPGYYKGSSPYRPVEKESAQLLTHKDANRIEAQLRRLGYKGAVMELAAEKLQS